MIANHRTHNNQLKQSAREREGEIMPINGANNARVPVCSPLQHNCKFRQSTYYLHVQFDLAAGGDYESPSFWYGFCSVAWYLLLIETGGGAWLGTLYCSRNT